MHVFFDYKTTFMIVDPDKKAWCFPPEGKKIFLHSCALMRSKSLKKNRVIIAVLTVIGIVICSKMILKNYKKLTHYVV